MLFKWKNTAFCDCQVQVELLENVAFERRRGALYVACYFATLRMHAPCEKRARENGRAITPSRLG